MTVQTPAARNATLEDMVAMLRDQHARKHDVVAPATALRYRDGNLIVRGAETEITPDGVTNLDGVYRPTRTFDQQIAEKLGIPGRYASKLRATRVDLLDANVNGLLHGRVRLAGGERSVIADPDSRTFLVRTMRGADGQSGIARAVLSDRYGIIDNLDALTAALAGVRDAGVEVEITGCDLTDDRMYVRIVAPSVTAALGEVLAGYRSPFTGLGAHDAMNQPVAFAGLHISNSETGGGAFTITPRMVVQVCSNGMTVTRDAVRAVHLGGRLDEGVIRWTRETERKQLDLITAKTRDAVATFLDVEYMRGVIADMTDKAVRPVPAATAVQTVGKALKFSDEVTQGVLDHFVRGGQTTAGGVFQAVTSYAQVVRDPEAAHALESSAFRALEVAAAL
jgi:hypothetical protein